MIVSTGRVLLFVSILLSGIVLLGMNEKDSFFEAIEQNRQEEVMRFLRSKADPIVGLNHVLTLDENSVNEVEAIVDMLIAWATLGQLQDNEFQFAIKTRHSHRSIPEKIKKEIRNKQVELDSLGETLRSLDDINIDEVYKPASDVKVEKKVIKEEESGNRKVPLAGVARVLKRWEDIDVREAYKPAAQFEKKPRSIISFRKLGALAVVGSAVAFLIYGYWQKTRSVDLLK